MNTGSVVLVGGPASGKTNYIARLWLAFEARKGTLRADQLPQKIQYVDDAVKHLMALRFAPRSERNMEDGRRDFVIEVRGNSGAGQPRNLSVPDITGELWRRAVNTYELPQEWIDELRASSSAILFIRAHSRHNLQPMDWVTARDILQMHANQAEGGFDLGEEEDDDEEDEEDEEYDEAPIDGADGLAAAKEAKVDGQCPTDTSLLTEDATGQVAAKMELPAQVGFCELLRYLGLLLSDRSDGSKPRVAIIVTAWDMLDPAAKAAGPMEYLKKQFPLLAGRILTPSRLDIQTFGMSIVGGNLRRNPAFCKSLEGRDLSEVGYTAIMRNGAVEEDPDVTLPVAWAVGD